MAKLYIHEDEVDPEIITKLNRAYWMALAGLLLAIVAVGWLILGRAGL